MEIFEYSVIRMVMYMNTTLLESESGDGVQTYLTKKFKEFKSGFYTKESRRAKCIRYYVAASNANRGTVESIYEGVFKEAFPIGQAKKYLAKLQRQASGPLLVGTGEYIAHKHDRISKGEALLAQLNQWKADGEYQMGERFFTQLMDAVGKYDKGLISATEFQAEWEINRVANLTGSFSKTAKQVSTEWDGMLGIKQHAGVSFKADVGRWGEISAKLEESFKAGSWTKGSASAEMHKLGFSAEVQVAVAMGLELNMDGSATWKKDKVGIDLSGNMNLFVGAQASLQGNLSVNALKGLAASFELNAFAGFSASVTGTAAFTYADKELVSATATAYVLFGVGGNVSGSINAPIFGPTQIAFSRQVAVGLGHGVSCSTAINFSEIAMASSEQFRKLAYLPTLAQGTIWTS